MNQKSTLLITLAFLCLTFLQLHANKLQVNQKRVPQKYSEHIVHYADEFQDKTHKNRLITLDYKAMELLDTQEIEGSLNHHADPLGTLEDAKYMMMVPKGSNFVTIRSVSTGNFIKRIRLPFHPRSGDAYNKKYNLILLTARNRPAAVLIDAKYAKIVGKAGFDIQCGLRNPSNVYADTYLYNLYYPCYSSDFGGDQMSGHPLWLDANHFVILDRDSRLLHVYKITRKTHYDTHSAPQWETALVQTLKTESSMHQIIPEDKTDENNTIFYGMTEGGVKEDSLNSKIIPRVYKYLFDGNELKELLSTQMVIDYEVENGDIEKVFGALGHNLYITPDKEYLYAPMGGQIHQKSWKQQQRLYGGIFVISTNNLKVITHISAGKGAGHVAFSKQKKIAIVTNHMSNFVTAIDYSTHTRIKNIPVKFKNENNFSLTQSHMQHISEDGEYYYNFWTQGGVFFRVNLSTLLVDKTVYTGGTPIQGNFYRKVATNTSDIPLTKEDGYEDFFMEKNSINSTKESLMKPYHAYSSKEKASDSNGYNK